MSSKKNIVIVGGGFAGTSVAKALSAKLDPSQYDLILINALPYTVETPAALRLVVSPTAKLEESILVPLDRLYKNGNGQTKVGIVVSIEVKEGTPGGVLVLESDERIPYEILVIASGSKWQGPIDLPMHEQQVLPHVRSWRDSFAKAKHVVIVGGGSVGIELAGELKDEYPHQKVTIVQGGNKLLNKVYPDSFRDSFASRLRARGVEFLFNEYIDSFPEEGSVGVVTRNGTEIPTADLVVSARGPVPNTEFVNSLGSSALSGSGYIKVKPTLQLVNHSNIFALGDAIDWNEQKQAAKVSGHSAVVVQNILSLLAGSQPTAEYKGSREMIVITNGRDGGMGYFAVLWGITIGDFLSSLLKSKTFMVDKFRAGLGY